MKFIEEKQLRNAFWGKYGYRKNILNYQFECNIRHGNIDLVTIETVKYNNDDRIIFIGWEFKLNDIKKAIAQAEINLKYCHKVFVVIPLEKRSVIEDKYLSYLKKMKYIGVIGMKYNEGWEVIYQPFIQIDENVKLNQKILDLLRISSK